MFVETPLASRTLVELAATQPLAATVFRRFGFDFCCLLDAPLAQVAAAHDVSLAAVESALDALPGPAAGRTVPRALAPLIGHIIIRYHTVHRRELPALIRLAAAIEARRPGHPARPYGLADALCELEDVLEEQMRHEESEVFPGLFRRPDTPADLFKALHDGHEELASYLCCIETLTDGHCPPVDAGSEWRRLYAGTAKLVDDLMRHRYLEDGRLVRAWQGAAPSTRAH